MNEWGVCDQAKYIAKESGTSNRDKVKKILSLGAGQSYHGQTYTGLAKVIDRMYIESLSPLLGN